MRERTRAEKIFDRLVDQSVLMSSIGQAHKPRYALYVRKLRAGQDVQLDEDLKPGWLVKRLSEQDREALQELTSDMTQVRQEWVFG